MIELKAKDGFDVVINVSDRHLHWETGSNFDPRVRAAINALRSLPVAAPLSDKNLEDIEIVVESGVCLAPSYFLRGKTLLNRFVVHHLVAEDDFATSLYDALQATGEFDFVQGIQGAATAQSYLHRIAAVFAFSAVGQGSLENVGSDFARAMISWFRTPDDSRWRADFDRNPLLCQCLGAFVRGLAVVFGDPYLLESSGNRRSYAGRYSSWKEFVASDDPVMSEVSTRLEAFLQVSRLSPKGMKATARHLAEWIAEDYPSHSLKAVCSLQERDRGFPVFLERRRGRTDRQHVTLVVNAKKLTDFFIEQLETENPGKVFRPLISESEVERARNTTLMPARPGSARSRPLPEKLFALTKSILDEGENGWPGRCSSFQVEVNGASLFCPVIPTLFRCALDIPLRVVQWRRLDSSEGDVRRFNAETMAWETNTGPWAGFWADSEGKSRQGFPERGYARELTDGQSSIVGIHANTNKTGKPYTLPWQHVGVHRRLWELRLWQEKHNPIEGPLEPEQYLDDPAEVSQLTKEQLPRIFPLFRLFPTRARNFKGRIPTAAEMDHSWQYLMAEVERVWNLENPDNPLQIVERHPTTGQVHRARYNLHGMRVRGLTDLYRAGMPLEVISKVVAGHATVRMTLYYTQFDPVEIDRQLTQAAVDARALAAQDVMNDFARLSLEEARRKTVALSPAVIEDAHALGNNLTFTNVDIGFCPWECSRCGDGGPVKRSSELKNGTSKTIYQSVPGGRQNCILCRHLISGPPWMFQLELYGTKLLSRRKHLAQREAACIAECEELARKYQAGEIKAAWYRQTWDAKQAELTRIKDDQELVETSVFNVGALLHACIALTDQGSDQAEHLPMVASSRGSVIQYIETPEFDNSLLQTAASRLYAVLEDPNIEAIRDRYLNNVLFDSGATPPLLVPQLTDKQRRDAMDVFAGIMLRQLSIAQRRALVEGDERLVDTETWKDVRAIMNAALKNEIKLLPGDTAANPEIEAAVLEVLK